MWAEKAYKIYHLLIPMEAEKTEVTEKLREALKEYFEPSEEVTASHTLYNNFKSEYGEIVTKFQAYVCWNAAWGLARHKDSAGDLGYKMKVKSKEYA